MKVFNSYVFLLLLLLTGSASALSAQNRAISGRVLDALQEPLIGVTVGIEGSSRGSVTDINGVFELQIPISGATLNFSYVGYITEKVKVKGRSHHVGRGSSNRLWYSEKGKPYGSRDNGG